MFGLSKERPILGHHAKAHILKSGGFHEIWQISPAIWQISCEIHPKPYKIRCFNKNSSIWGVQGGGYDPGFHEILVHSPSPAFIKLNSFGWNICFYKVLGGFHMKSAGFHVKLKSKIERPLAGNCNLMFIILEPPPQVYTSMEVIEVAMNGIPSDSTTLKKYKWLFTG